MGAWDNGIYDNDDALDFVAELTESDDLAPVVQALEAATAGGEDYLEADAGQIGLAAAGVVAYLAGQAGPEIDPETADELKAWVDRTKPTADAALIAAARAAVARILAPRSEIRDLWEETDEADAWKAKVEDLAARLEKAA